jgi:hypothetical protein
MVYFFTSLLCVWGTVCIFLAPKIRDLPHRSIPDHFKHHFGHNAGIVSAILILYLPLLLPIF